MGNFNRGGSFGGGRGRSGGFGGRDGGKPRFPKRSFGGGQGGFDKEMHKAVCGECSKPCEVPFRPTAGKPVFCRDCFASKGSERGRDDRGGDRFPRRDFGDRKPSFDKKPEFEKTNKGISNDALSSKIDDLHVKLDRLTKKFEAFVNVVDTVNGKNVVKDISAVASKKEVKEIKEEVVVPAKKVAKKKVLAKKGK